MTQLLVTFRKRRPHRLYLHRPAPLRRGSNCSAVGAEADQVGLFAELFAAQVADVVLAAGGHFSRACVADMRIVRPHDGFAVRPMEREQGFQSSKHMTIAQIPGITP